MKRIMLFALTALVLSSACEENNKVVVGNKTTMEVNSIFDAGTVTKGEIIKAKFKVKNTGEYPLVFGEVKGSCSCTVTDFPSEPLSPGKTAVIEANVDTEQTGSGQINKSVSIMANTEKSVTTVFVKANVQER